MALKERLLPVYQGEKNLLRSFYMLSSLLQSSIDVRAGKCWPLQDSQSSVVARFNIPGLSDVGFLSVAYKLLSDRSELKAVN